LDQVDQIVEYQAM